jgi:ABC-2 type transport system ATP-binding protein
MIPIRLKHVSKSFSRRGQIGTSNAGEARRDVLRDVSLEVSVGEVVCILGKNGSGKTTLARIISTLIEPDRGEVNVCGFDAVRNPGEARRYIGVMLNAGEGGFQSRLSASSNLLYYAALYQIPMKQAKDRIGLLMSQLGLADRGSDQYQSFSSGTRRRLALVRALLPDAPILLLDEPTLGVDPWTTENVHKHLLELSNEGKTILCTTNNIAEARILSDRTYQLEDGKLLSHEMLEATTA